MRYAALFLMILGVESFSPLISTTSHRHLTKLDAGKLTAAQIIARARKAAGVATEDENEEGPPELFSEKVYEDIQTTLVMLDKVIKKNGLTPEQYREFAAATDSVLDDLRGRESGATAEAATPAPVAFVPPPTSSAVPAPPPPSSVAPPPPPPPLPPPPAASAAAAEGKKVVSINEKFAKDLETDHEEFQSSGYGMASGTRNTYEIEGMHSMSPEDYRKALQNKVLADQEERRIQRAGVVGNRAAMSYLDDLNQGAAPEEQKWKTGTSSEEYKREMERRRGELR